MWALYVQFRLFWFNLIVGLRSAAFFCGRWREQLPVELWLVFQVALHSRRVITGTTDSLRQGGAWCSLWCLVFVGNVLQLRFCGWFEIEIKINKKISSLETDLFQSLVQSFKKQSSFFRGWCYWLKSE